MANIIINATSNSYQTGVIITDQTDWAALGGSINDLSSVVINLYGSTLVTAYKVYNLTAGELSSFKSNGEIEIPFSTLAGTTYLDDGWWTIRVTANTLSYLSNYSEFGIWATIQYMVFSDINSLHTPEDIKYEAEKFCIKAMFSLGLEYLDTSNVNQRGDKFRKRLVSLQKMMSSI
jgi:hypothetical protein